MTARHLVVCRAQETWRHCRYLGQILSTPRPVKLDHILQYTASLRLHSCVWTDRPAITHDGLWKIRADIQISILNNGRWRGQRGQSFKQLAPTTVYVTSLNFVLQIGSLNSTWVPKSEELLRYVADRYDM
jgi:hypothetical protein